MPTSIRPSDILWTRTGDPVLVKNINDKSGEVDLENNFSKIQENTKNGLKNGLTIEEREAYKTSLANVQSPDKKQEIRELHNKIKSLKEGNTNPRLLKYLENELQYRMIREDYTPDDFPIKPVTLDI